MSKTVAVIDGNSLMHRAFHAVPPTMNAPDGTPTNAVFGFFSMLLKFIDESNPDAVICAFDAGKPQFRIDALEQYKAQRPPMDNDLRVQFPVVEKLLASMNIPIVKMPGWEGDDILGTVAAQDEALGYKTLLLTGDKDACQLASDLTSIVSMKKGVSDIVVMGPAEVVEKYGVGPELIPDYLGLMGDSSDNIPGVPGVGPKTASKLLQQFGSIEGIYDNLDKLKGKQLENIRDNKQAAFVSREVATIVRDVALEIDPETVAFPSYTEEAVKTAFNEIHLHAHLGHVLRYINSDAQAMPSLQIAVCDPLTGNSAVKLFKQCLENGDEIALCVAKHEAKTLFDEECLALGFACEQQSGEQQRGYLDGPECTELLASALSQGAVICEDLKELMHVVFPVDSALPAQISVEDLLQCKAIDLGLAGYVLNSSAGQYDLEHLVQQYLNCSLPNTEELSEECQLALRAAVCLALKQPLCQRMKEAGNDSGYFSIDLPLVSVLAVLERNGAALDIERLQQLGQNTQVEIDELKQQIFALAGETFNIDSPKQLGHVLFDVLGMEPKKKTKGKKGYSTDASVLSELARDHELPGLVLKYRELAKIKSTYIDALPPLRAGDGLVHTSFNEKVTTTGRLSSSDPNLQNIPVRTEFGRKIRECFIPLSPDHVYVSADYSQIELRLLAHLSEDEGLIAAFSSNADFHASTAAQVFGVPLDQVTPEMRSRAKAVNFGIVYGQKAYGLSHSLGIAFDEAKDMIDRYFATYPRVRTYLDETVAFASKHGFAQTMFGRKRYIPELAQRNPMRKQFGERTAMNHPMQGSAADIIKIAMRRVQERLVQEKLQARILLQVHDELDLSVPRNELSQVEALLKDVMEHAARLRVPLKVDVSHGANWSEAH